MGQGRCVCRGREEEEVVEEEKEEERERVRESEQRGWIQRVEPTREEQQ